MYIQTCPSNVVRSFQVVNNSTTSPFIAFRDIIKCFTIKQLPIFMVLSRTMLEFSNAMYIVHFCIHRLDYSTSDAFVAS